ncbi:MAG: AAA family ATPase [Desulfamplus sp.]|nr:AAA family ATPase [Desulfamplus sp.]
MKIIKLRFKNLNSLYGEWLIDFTSPEYTTNGIFALTGPTGAGKSTILDAICLALYGATPRLGKITKNSNEIMSRQTGDCYSEVTFESQDRRFRTHWSQHRSRKKSDGKLADAKHEIADATSGQLLESKRRDVALVIEEKTGMDFDRFTRSILLAQGGFDTFLKAEAEQKSRILEQITGTEIYTEISRSVHERYRDENEKLKILQNNTNNILILNSEQELQMVQELGEKQSKESELNLKFLETNRAIEWLTLIDGFKKEISSISEEYEKLNFVFSSFKPEREKLENAIKAAQFDGQYAILISVRTQNNEDSRTLKIEEGKLPEVESYAMQREESLKNTEESSAKAKEEKKSAALIIQKARYLDMELSNKKRSIEEIDADCKNDCEQIEVDKKLMELNKKRVKIAKNNLTILEAYFIENGRDEWLISGFAGIKEQLNNLILFQKDTLCKKELLLKVEETLKNATKKLETHRVELTNLKDELSNVEKDIESKNKKLNILLCDRLLREYRTEKDTLLMEMAFLRKITQLESERDKLEDGKQCPLCGSREHPFAKGNTPKLDETGKKIEILTALIVKAEKLESAIKKLEAVEKERLKKVTDTEKLESEAENENKNANKNLIDITNELTKTADRFDNSKIALLSKLQPLGIEEISDLDLHTLPKTLKERLDRWLDKLNQQSEIQKNISTLESDLKRVDAIIETRNRALLEKTDTLVRLKKELEEQERERFNIFGTKNPDIEEARLDKIISDAEATEKSARIARDKANQQLNLLKLSINSLKERIGRRVSELKELETDFISSILKAGFADEQIFLSNLMTIKEREIIKAKAKELDDCYTNLQALKKDRENRLNLEIGKKITESKIEELIATNRDCEDTLKNLRDEIATLKYKLDDNQVAKNRIKEKQFEIDYQKREFSRWEKLHALIGSSDGKKYRNFAQGLTFELMISHANQELIKMTDRYLLVRDKEEPLELNVVDNYQAGEVRSTKNLSGGESFIVSLTLALGLSRMSSRRVRVDSLFLDEGFGTLDEESLESALTTLSGLQQDGKLIGIISHIPALKERITTQINIYPVYKGKSTIVGPGCKKQLS